jgi:hypothetical protein
MKQSKARRFDPRPHIWQHRSTWKLEYLNLDNRFVDRGHMHPGPSALDLFQMQRRHVLAHKIGRSVFRTSIFLLLALTAVTAAIKFIDFNSLGKTVTESQNAIFSISTILLTFGLLIVTWRYVNLTASILSEMKEARRHDAEPRIEVYTSGRLEAEANLTYSTDVTIRNVGNSPILDLDISYDLYGADTIGGSSGVMKVSTLFPESEYIHKFICYDRTIEPYLKVVGSGYDDINVPFVTFRITFRDSFSRLYSLTQDYALHNGESDYRRIVLLCEFTSSPIEYRWRARSDRFSMQPF